MHIKHLLAFVLYCWISQTKVSATYKELYLKVSVPVPWDRQLVSCALACAGSPTCRGITRTEAEPCTLHELQEETETSMTHVKYDFRCPAGFSGGLAPSYPLINAGTVDAPGYIMVFYVPFQSLSYIYQINMYAGASGSLKFHLLDAVNSELTQFSITHTVTLTGITAGYFTTPINDLAAEAGKYYAISWGAGIVKIQYTSGPSNVCYQGGSFDVGSSVTCSVVDTREYRMQLLYKTCM